MLSKGQGCITQILSTKKKWKLEENGSYRLSASVVPVNIQYSIFNIRYSLFIIHYSLYPRNSYLNTISSHIDII